MDNKMFELADTLRELRNEKTDTEAMLKEINAEIETVELELSDVMVNAECSNFTRGDKQFVLMNTTRWSPEADCKDDLYTALKENGFEHLFTVNAQTLNSFVREQVEETADADGVTHIPTWLDGLVKSYDQIAIQMRKITKK